MEEKYGSGPVYTQSVHGSHEEVFKNEFRAPAWEENLTNESRKKK